MRTQRLVAIGCLLTLTACVPLTHQPARDPGQVTAVKKFSVPGRLYAVKGGTLYRFSRTEANALTKGIKVRDPAVTLDGTRLAYAQLDGDGSTIVVSDPDIHESHAVTPVAGPEGRLWAFAPAFAPDGRSLAYLTDRGKLDRPRGSLCCAPDLAVWRYDLVRPSYRRLIQPNAFTGGDADPTWRPGQDGQLLYTTYSYEGEPPASVARITWFSTASGRNLFLSPGGARNFQAAWSPDGKAVAYIRAGTRSDDLYVMTLPPTFQREPQPYPTESATLLQAGMIAHPVWAPDGSALAFLMLTNGSFDLYVLPLMTDGSLRPVGPPVAITRNSFFDADSRLAWSP